MSDVAEVNDTDFDSEVLQADKPVLVDFWAPWCGPCRQIAPMIDELAADNSDSAKVVKVNVDDSQATAEKYSVFSIPTLMVFKNGEVVQKFQGGQPKAVLQKALDSATG